MSSSITLHLVLVWLSMLHGGIWFQMKGLSSPWLMLSISYSEAYEERKRTRLLALDMSYEVLCRHH